MEIFYWAAGIIAAGIFAGMAALYALPRMQGLLPQPFLKVKKEKQPSRDWFMSIAIVDICTGTAALSGI